VSEADEQVDWGGRVLYAGVVPEEGVKALGEDYREILIGILYVFFSSIFYTFFFLTVSQERTPSSPSLRPLQTPVQHR
jgi:hypothetical protein